MKKIKSQEIKSQETESQEIDIIITEDISESYNNYYHDDDDDDGCESLYYHPKVFYDRD